MRLAVRGLSLGYGGKEVLGDIDLEFPSDRVTCVLGPSGCGKSSLLHVLAGLRSPGRGEVQREGEVSYCFQEPRLLPWMTVRENVAYVLPREMDPTDRSFRVQTVLEKVGLADAATSYPAGLSGGMAQRTALARSLVVDAPILLLDEPLSAVDVGLRARLIDVVLAKRTGRVTVLATHDLEVAEAMGDELYLLAGRPARVRRTGVAELRSLDWDRL